jgi:valyl-tRNA synthetase
VDNSELFAVASEKELRGKLSGALSADDEHILSELEAAINVATEHIEALRLHEAAQEIYQFAWHAFADVYIEISKNQLKTQQNQENTKLVLAYVLATIVKLLHPFMPFITEEIWSLLSESNYGKKMLMLERWPK